jgi:3-hydroxyacyl-CoA dehydrogenase
LSAAEDVKVRFRVEDGVAILTLNNPPVNALGAGVRKGLLDALSRAKSDPEVKAIVLAAEGKLFSGGADISEFDKAPQPPSLSEVIAALGAGGKPVVAAIHGSAFGGGLELPLGCDARVATATAKVGLPEIKLGIIPGAGGTQRLPRLIGAKAAFEIMAKGDPVPAKQALALGIIDAIAEGDLLATAKAKALELAAKPDRKNRMDLLSRSGERASFEEAASAALKGNPGSPNVVALVEAVRAAFDKPLAEGLAFEREQFVKLRDNDRSKALRYAFFAERKASRIANLPEGTGTRPIARAAIVGAGTMGAGIAINFANAGIPVTIIETKEDALSKGIERITSTIDASLKRGSLSQGERDRRIGMVKGALGLDAASDADIIVEAVFEELTLKKEIFGTLDRLAKPGAILATNTSYLDVNEIAATTRRPQDVLGLHFFSPANIMRLLEIVRGAKTAPDVLKTCVELAPKLGKVPVVVGVCYGFVGNRMLSRRSQQGERMLIEGALPHEIDAAMVNFGFRMGPFAAGDLAGLDIGWRIRKQTSASASVADALCELGRFGQKTGKGYYLYAAGARTGAIDPEVETIIIRVSARLGVTRRKLPPEEIIDRLIFPMVNEGARILSEGIAARASDIDVIWANGYGWPTWRGGPMYYADHVGLSRVVSRLDELAAATGEPTLKPAALLRELAGSGRKFTDEQPERSTVG